MLRHVPHSCRQVLTLLPLSTARTYVQRAKLDRVVVFVRVVAKGSASGVPIELPDAHVVSIRNGRVASTRVYRDRAEALEAVGLRE
jgi:ketosteroid isomerase-like protein